MSDIYENAPLFATTQEIAKELGISKTAAVEMFTKFGVRSHDFGKGRGRGFRWYRPDVAKAVKGTINV